MDSHNVALLLSQFARRSGISVSQLVHMAAHALAVHLATGAPLILPLTIGSACPRCNITTTEPRNIIAGPW